MEDTFDISTWLDLGRQSLELADRLAMRTIEHLRNVARRADDLSESI